MSTPRRRIRRRTNLKINKQGFLDIYTLEGSFIERQAIAVDNYTSFEYIDDIVGDASRLLPKTQWPLHPVFHEKHRWVGQKDYPDWVDFNRVDGNPYPFPSHPDVTTAFVPSVPEAALSVVAKTAYDAFYDQIPTEVSIANFLYELKDIKAMLPRLSKNLLGSATSNFLGYQFGWKPFLSDLRKLGSLTKSVHRRLKFLKDTSGKPTRIHSRAKGFYTPTTWSTPWGTAIYQSPLEFPNTVQGAFFTEQQKLFGKLSEYAVDFTASAVLLQKLEGLDSRLGELAAFSSALGLNNPAAIVWEAIPYSFVVDWFTNIGSWANQLEVQPFTGTWNVSNVTCSVNYRAWVDFYAHPWFEYGNPLTNCGRVQVERYQRYVGLPVKVSSISLTDLDLRRQTLLESLLFQRSILNK
jgi:hypothetical protein